MKSVLLGLAVLLGVVMPQASAQEPLPVLPPPNFLPPPSVVPAAVLPVLTVADFAKNFKPLPGTIEVVLLHPFTNCPVKVCFKLPDGCPKRVQLHHRRRLEFDYGKREVNIIFDRKGGVQVKYS